MTSSTFHNCSKCRKGTVDWPKVKINIYCIAYSFINEAYKMQQNTNKRWQCTNPSNKLHAVMATATYSHLR